MTDLPECQAQRRREGERREPGLPPDLGADSGRPWRVISLLMSHFRICKISLAMPPLPNHFDSQMKASIKVPRIAIN